MGGWAVTGHILSDLFLDSTRGRGPELHHSLELGRKGWSFFVRVRHRPSRSSTLSLWTSQSLSNWLTRSPGATNHCKTSTSMIPSPMSNRGGGGHVHKKKRGRVWVSLHGQATTTGRRESGLKKACSAASEGVTKQARFPTRCEEMCGLGLARPRRLWCLSYSRFHRGARWSERSQWIG